MKTAIEKADVLIEALGWIRRFRNKTTVIKLGGSLMQDEESLLHVLLDLVFMETVGMRPVIVHGGGAAISRAMDDAGIEPRFIHGRRYTDEKTLGIVKQVLAKDVNERIVETINRLDGDAVSLNFWTGNVLQGKRICLADENGGELDLGFVGKVTDVDVDSINDVLHRGAIPVIPSMCLDTSADQILNVNADTAATTVAQRLQAEKLVYISDVNGVRMDKDDPSSRIQSLRASEARELIRNGTIHSGMIPKVEACLETLECGVRKVHIVDGRIRHSLLLEIYTTTGIGTEIVLD